MTQNNLAYRPEVLAEYDFPGTPDDLIEELCNGIRLHREGVTYGIWHALTPAERHTAITRNAITDTTPQRERKGARTAGVDGQTAHSIEAERGVVNLSLDELIRAQAALVREFQMLHRADLTVTHPPTDTFVTNALANFGYAIWISEGRAVGYMALSDGTDDPATWDGVYEALTNIWVAHADRRSGVATCASGIRAGTARRSNHRLDTAFLPGRRRLGAG